MMVMMSPVRILRSACIQMNLTSRLTMNLWVCLIYTQTLVIVLYWKCYMSRRMKYSTLQSNDESQIDVVGLDDGELTVLDQALCHNDTDALNDDDMGVL